MPKALSLVHKINFHIISLLILTVLCTSGCAFFFPAPDEQLASELAADGVDEYKSGNYRQAIEHFEKLRDWYPFDKYAILAELKIADAHYKLQEYDEALLGYEKFEQLHPKNEAIPYVIYQMGRCHFDQIDTVDRDQTSAQAALSIFKRLIHQFPDSGYALQARQKLKQCLKSITGHELYVGMFYYKAKHYKAALNRFKVILSDYPDVGCHKQALEYITLCEAELSEAHKPADKN